MPGEVADDSAAIRAVDSRSALTDTSSGTKVPRSPCRVNASSSSRVFSEEPEPNSISVLAPLTVTISAARSRNTVRSAPVW